MNPSASVRVLTEPPAADLRCEIAIVGSGPGGAVTASILAAAGCDVLLVEEGDHLPLDSCPPFSRTELEQKYRSGGLTVAMGQPKVHYVEGCCVGGGSEINSGLYHRTSPELLGRWQQEFAVEALSLNDLLPHFRACEEALSVGYLPGSAPRASLKLEEGAERLGWSAQEVPRWFRYEPAPAPGTLPRGTKQSMTQTFIPQALQAGAQLLPQTRVLRLRRLERQWQLHCRWRDRPLAIAADTVFVCGGAVQTPALLRRSGLRRHVGDRLQMHPTVKLLAQFAETVNVTDMGVPVHQVKQFAPHYSFGCSISSPPYLALAMDDHPAHLGAVREHWQQMAIYYAALTGGWGTVRCLPGCRDPLVRYHISSAELHVLSEALQKLALLLFEAGAIALYPSIAGSTPLLHRDDLRSLPEVLPRSRTNLMTVHLTSSCPMGERRDRCATNSFGRVWDADNLYISDASLLCTAPGVNPQGAIMAIARRNALHFLGKL